jgi:hypothetical protein
MKDLATLEEAYKLTMREALLAEKAIDAAIDAARAARANRDAAFAAWRAACLEPNLDIEDGSDVVVGALP